MIPIETEYEQPRLPTGCYPGDFWRNLYNLSDQELNGGLIVKLGLPTFQLQRCECKSEETER